MALAKKVFDALSNKLQRLNFDSPINKIPADENSSSSVYDHFTRIPEEKESLPIQVPLSQTLDISILEKKIKQLINKLHRKNLHLHVFNHLDIQYGPVLGKGAEGVVQRCRVFYNNLYIDAAAKTVLSSTEDNLDVTLHEIELLCLAKDPIMSTVIQVYGIAAVPRWDDPSRGHLVIVTEVGLKNLLQLYQHESVPLSVTLKLWHDLAIALHFLHCKHIIHQDLKPENILVTSLSRDTCGNLVKVEMKIIDLGLSLVVPRGRVESEDVPGTVGYHAPEVLFDDTYDFKADIFVLAVVFCVVLLPRKTLQSSEALKAFLTQLHTSKKNGLSGPSLYMTEVQPQFDTNVVLPPCLVQLICSMLEKAEDRDVTLLDIATLCISQSVLLQHHSPPTTTNLDSHSSSGNNAHDSGVMSDHKGKGLRGKRRYPGDDDDDDADGEEEEEDDDMVDSETRNANSVFINWVHENESQNKEKENDNRQENGKTSILANGDVGGIKRKEGDISINQSSDNEESNKEKIEIKDENAVKAKKFDIDDVKKIDNKKDKKSDNVNRSLEKKKSVRLLRTRSKSFRNEPKRMKKEESISTNFKSLVGDSGKKMNEDEEKSSNLQSNYSGCENFKRVLRSRHNKNRRSLRRNLFNGSFQDANIPSTALSNKKTTNVNNSKSFKLSETKSNDLKKTNVDSKLAIKNISSKLHHTVQADSNHYNLRNQTMKSLDSKDKISSKLSTKPSHSVALLNGDSNKNDKITNTDNKVRITRCNDKHRTFFKSVQVQPVNIDEEKENGDNDVFESNKKINDNLRVLRNSRNRSKVHVEKFTSTVMSDVINVADCTHNGAPLTRSAKKKFMNR